MTHGPMGKLPRKLKKRLLGTRRRPSRVWVVRMFQSAVVLAAPPFPGPPLSDDDYLFFPGEAP